MDNINVSFVSAEELRKFVSGRNETTKILEKLEPEIIEAAKRGETKVVYPYHISGNDVEYSRTLGKSVESFLLNKGYNALVQYDSIGFSLTIEW